jgi:hypothetical protein
MEIDKALRKPYWAWLEKVRERGGAHKNKESNASALDDFIFSVPTGSERRRPRVPASMK